MCKFGHKKRAHTQYFVKKIWPNNLLWFLHLWFVSMFYIWNKYYEAVKELLRWISGAWKKNKYKNPYKRIDCCTVKGGCNSFFLQIRINNSDPDCYLDPITPPYIVYITNTPQYFLILYCWPEHWGHFDYGFLEQKSAQLMTTVGTFPSTYV